MARYSPTPGQKITYFIFIALGISILYLDINSKIFSGLKNNFQSLKISSSFVIQNISVNPVKEFIELIRSKQRLIDENTMLKDKLDETFLRNFLISKENTFYTEPLGSRDRQTQLFLLSLHYCIFRPDLF